MDPLFTTSATDRELNALKSYPFHKLGTGNIKTLKEDVDKSINVRDESLKFHHKYYSSPVMKLAFVGKQNMNELSNMVTNIFSPVINKKSTEPKYFIQIGYSQLVIMII